MRLHRPLPVFIVIAALLTPIASTAEVSKVTIASRTPVADGQSFGSTGPYEKLTGTIEFSLDPKDRHNAKIADLSHAPRAADGLVHFSADLYVLQPTNAARGNGVLLVTGDRDAFQLVTDNVSVVTTRKGITDIVTYGPAEVLEHYGVTAEQVPDYLGLKGDTSDNIPGVPGIGEKTAAKLLQEYGTLERVLESAGEIKGKLGENLREHAGAALASRTVATIACDVPLDIDVATISFGDFDPRAVAEAFGRYRFTSLLERVLTLRSSGGSVEPGKTEAPQALPAEKPADRPAPATGVDALASIRQWAAAPEWIGVAVDDGASEALFGEERVLAVATPERVAVVDDAAASEALGVLFGSAHIASGDAKALLQEACPPDEVLPCDEAALATDPARLFDVGVAAYLLESNRSSYELAALSADYLGAPLPAPAEGEPLAAVLASSAARLAPELEGRLESDGSLGVLRDIEMPLVPVLVVPVLDVLGHLLVVPACARPDPLNTVRPASSPRRSYRGPAHVSVTEAS